jgi:Zn finger protein HypA/HybF involved in hydrogenase expression
MVRHGLICKSCYDEYDIRDIKEATEEADTQGMVCPGCQSSNFGI